MNDYIARAATLAIFSYQCCSWAVKQQLQLQCTNLTRLAFFTIPLLLFFALALFLHACLATQLTTFFRSKSATHSWPPFSHQPPNPTQGKIWKLPSWTRFTAEGGGPAKWVAKSHQCSIFQIAEVRPPHLPRNLDAPDVLIAPSILCSALVIPPSLTAFHNDWFQHWRISHCILKSKEWCKSN